MSPACNGSTALLRFERGNALEIRNRIMFDFYPGLPHISLVLGGDIVTYSVHLPSNGVSGGPAMIPFSLVTSDWSMISTFIEHAWACMEECVNQNKMQQLMKEVAKWRVGSSYALVPGSTP